MLPNTLRSLIREVNGFVSGDMGFILDTHNHRETCSTRLANGPQSLFRDFLIVPRTLRICFHLRYLKTHGVRPALRISVYSAGEYRL